MLIQPEAETILWVSTIKLISVALFMQPGLMSKFLAKSYADSAAVGEMMLPFFLLQYWENPYH